MPFNTLKPKVTTLLSNNEDSVDLRLTEVCELLRGTIGYYDWVGFYFADEPSRTLHLKAFAGEETEHTVIPFGKGICGQVAESSQIFMVPDVKAQSNYLSCNRYVKAEIVVPLFKEGKNIGQIDIDSNTLDPFSVEDKHFLEWLNSKVAEIL